MLCTHYWINHEKHNETHDKYESLQYRESGQSAWVYFITEKISADATSFVMRNLTANSTYLIKLAAKNEWVVQTIFRINIFSPYTGANIKLQ